MTHEHLTSYVCGSGLHGLLLAKVTNRVVLFDVTCRVRCYTERVVLRATLAATPHKRQRSKGVYSGVVISAGVRGNAGSGLQQEHAVQETATDPSA